MKFDLELKLQTGLVAIFLIAAISALFTTENKSGWFCSIIWAANFIVTLYRLKWGR